MTTLLKLADVFQKYNLEKGRMISLDKRKYMEKHPFNTIAFNGNIFIKLNDIFIKVWFGDLDVSLEGDTLKRIGEELNTTLYVLKEMDGRAKNEQTQEVEKVALWDTTKKTPFVDKKEHDSRMEEKEIEEQIKMNTRIADYERQKNLSNRLPIIELTRIFQTNIIEKIVITKEEMDIHFKKLFAITKTQQEMNPADFFFETLFANDLVDQKIRKTLKVDDLSDLRLTSLWIGEEFNNILNQYNKAFDRKFFSDEEIEEAYGNDSIFSYASYLSTLQYANTNELGYSNKTLENYTIYILEDYLNI